MTKYFIETKFGAIIEVDEFENNNRRDRFALAPSMCAAFLESTLNGAYYNGKWYFVSLARDYYCSSIVRQFWAETE